MARFGGTSATYPLILEEERSQGFRAVARGDPELVVWQFTETEAVSAITKRQRAHPPLTERERNEALRRLDLVATRCRVVSALDQQKLETIRGRARALMLRHPLRASDALQLAAALIYFGSPQRRGFGVGDGDLAAAAKAEGFEVFSPAAQSRGGRRRS